MTATIVAVRDTGMLLNGEPVLDIDLLIGAAGEAEPFRATAAGPVPPWALPGAVVGAEVTVRSVDGDRSVVLIDWEATTAP